ncbi:MAG: DinB family protein [Vicinamibacterales bacterium]
MSVAAPFVHELDAEAGTTRRVLERVPDAGLDWRPHPKSMSLGQLALHVATLPRQGSEFFAGDTLDISAAAGGPPMPESRDAILQAYDAALDHARGFFTGLSDARAAGTWTLLSGERVLFAAPRAAVIRSFLFNHWYHHRGQLVVYLRLRDIPVPSVYGPTADENPFADA